MCHCRQRHLCSHGWITRRSWCAFKSTITCVNEKKIWGADWGPGGGEYIFSRVKIWNEIGVASTYWYHWNHCSCPCWKVTHHRAALNRSALHSNRTKRSAFGKVNSMNLSAVDFECVRIQCPHLPSSTAILDPFCSHWLHQRHHHDSNWWDACLTTRPNPNCLMDSTIAEVAMPIDFPRRACATPCADDWSMDHVVAMRWHPKIRMQIQFQ